MIDPLLNKILRPPLALTAKPLIRLGITANQVTIFGFVLGILAVPAIIAEHFNLALVLILLNRVCDGLDGAVARQTRTTDAGGFLDISLDFIFYSAIVFAFIVSHPEQNAVAGSLLMLSFTGTGCCFLSFAIMASKHNIDNPQYPNKSLHYMGGLAEGFETIVVLCLFCLLPQHFVPIAFVYSAACCITAGVRIVTGYQTLKSID
ncbi:CDP-alcohol phosphatidyltransferase family protein [Paraglaciecola psychrophila]|uniref:CDP-alcohol phosphatidyltransferase n=1 Tax=Paraglaciecola psychrophila 170 TaxID=1129794 RepID=K6Z4P4_9ALTE|nr:CDP-alcohol phosphatidyltransferase family protein [Paraglaciecola psychrophila]AGH47599.1 CDP-alcohol phosphatidyltransferase [Paraglaciecola psychrophila 170]GAC40054.1 inner membrane protein ynjF [Paraglaciecola psychrophila 170]